MSYDHIFIATGQTPARGHVAPCRVSRPSPTQAKQGATLLVTGNPYRRVRRDAQGLYIVMQGARVPVFQVSHIEGK